MISDTDIIIRIILAVIFGSIIGLERERRHKPAGLRTNILVMLGSTLITLMAINIIDNFNPGGNADMGRIIGSIVTGIGFLGAGAIIQGRGSVHGLTTAATIWIVAAIGITIGLGYYAVAAACTIIVVVVLFVLGIIERREETKEAPEKKPDNE